MVEREHHHRNRQPQGVQQRRRRRHLARGGENAAVPVRNQVHRQKQQRDDERVNHQAHGLDDHLLAAAHHGQQAKDQHQRQHGARWRRDVQLMLKETAHGVGQRHAVDQQDREDREEVQQRDQRAGLDAEMFFHHFSDVGAFATGQHKTGQPAVRVERHREGQQRQDQQRPETAEARIDRQKQGARTNRRAKQAQHPGGVLAIPACKRRGCRVYIAFVNAIGLIIHPVGSPHSGHLPPGQDASEYPTGSARPKQGRDSGGLVSRSKDLGEERWYQIDENPLWERACSRWLWHIQHLLARHTAIASKLAPTRNCSVFEATFHRQTASTT
ncbi:hypothetical protein D3C86_1433330 [compost metagenome]